MLALSAKKDPRSPVSATSTGTDSVPMSVPEFEWDHREEVWYMRSGSSIVTTDLVWDLEMLSCAIRVSRSGEYMWRWGHKYDWGRVIEWFEDLGVGTDYEFLSNEWYRYWVLHGTRVLQMGTRWYRFSVISRLAAEGIRLYGAPFVKRSEV